MSPPAVVDLRPRAAQLLCPSPSESAKPVLAEAPPVVVETAEKVAEVDVRDGDIRYAAYAGRVGQFVRIAERVSSVRHLAYASDVGEAFRPAWPGWAVNATYGVAVAYVAADVAVQTAGAATAGAPPAELARVAAVTTAFQMLASVVAPFAAIHTAVHVAQGALKNQGPRLRAFGPSAFGLALIPLLPLVDGPVERGVNAAFAAAWPEGPEAAKRSAERAAKHAALHHAKQH